MDPTNECASGHYGALGVSPAASQRQIELAFRGWTDRRRAGAESADRLPPRRRAPTTSSPPPAPARVTTVSWGSCRTPRGRRSATRSSGACVRRALRELGQGRAGRARQLLDRAVSLAPDDPRARSYLALALARTGGCLHDADRHGRYRAVERRPREAAFFFNLAEVYAAAGLRARACAYRVRGWYAIAVSLFGRRRRV